MLVTTLFAFGLAEVKSVLFFGYSMHSFWSIHAILLLLLLFATTVPGLRLLHDPGCNLNRRDALVVAGKSMATAAATTATATLSTTTFQAVAAMDGPQPPSATGSRSSSSTRSTTTIPTWRLKRGVDFPKLALNTAGLDTEDTERAFRNALQAGISHVEFHPGIERDGVARVLRSMQGYPRHKVFLTTKIETNWEHSPSAQEAAGYVKQRLDTDLAILGVSSLDMLLLRESTDCSVMRAMWVEMERELEAGRVRSLGVANYCESALQCLLETAKYKPQVNYLQLHVGMGPSPKARAFGEQHGIKTLAYGHLGEKARPTDDTQQIRTSRILLDVAQKHAKSVDEIALRWVLQNGAAASVRPTADFLFLPGKLGGMCQDPECLEGLQASSQAFAWELSLEEMTQLNALQTPYSNPTLFSSPGCPGSYFARPPKR